ISPVHKSQITNHKSPITNHKSILERHTCPSGLSVRITPMRIALTLDRDVDPENNDYFSSLLRAGFRREEIEFVPPGAAPTGRFDGVLLGGGCDVEPSRYGESARSEANLELDLERDATDFALFAEAWPRGTPVLGVCRGLQVINVALGGTL